MSKKQCPPSGTNPENNSKSKRWLRNHTGTYECRIRKKTVYQSRIASHGVTVKKVFILLGHSGEKPRLELELEFKCKAGKISVRVPWEVLAEERAFLAICPVGFCVTSVQKAFALLRECLNSDVQSCPWEAVVQATGWFKFNDKFLFAHAGGKIGSDKTLGQYAHDSNNGTAQPSGIMNVNEACSDVPILTDVKKSVSSVRVELPPHLQRYRFPKISSHDELREAMAKVLELFSVGDRNVTYLTIPAIFATGIVDPRYALFLHGLTGSLKTHYALLLLSFFVPDPQEEDAASFKSTENALRAEFSFTKNVPVVVDDFTELPTARGWGDESRKADGLIRSLVNKTGKKRSKPNGALQSGPPPCGLPIITAESLPGGHDSLQKRCINCSIDDTTFADAIQGDRPNRFDEFQQLARDGVFAKAMAGFLAWAAPDLVTYRNYVQRGDGGALDDVKLHGRQKDAARTIVSGMVLLLDFALSVGACTEQEYESHIDKLVKVVNDWQRREYIAHLSNLPTERFTELILDALRARRCHLEVRNVDLNYFFGESDIPCELLGYSRHRELIPPPAEQSTAQQTASPATGGDSKSDNNSTPAANSSDEQQSSDSESNREQWKVTYRPHGTKIGDIGFEEIRFICSEALAVANDVASKIGVDRLPPPKQFGKFLARAGWLEKTNHDRNCYKVRVSPKRSIDTWIINVDRLFEIALDWGDFDINYYNEMNELERMKARNAIREKHFKRRRDETAAFQADSLLNLHLTDEDRQKLRGGPIPPPELRTINRKEFRAPKPPREPGYDDTEGLDLDA